MKTFKEYCNLKEGWFGFGNKKPQPIQQNGISPHEIEKNREEERKERGIGALASVVDLLSRNSGFHGEPNAELTKLANGYKNEISLIKQFIKNRNFYWKNHDPKNDLEWLAQNGRQIKPFLQAFLNKEPDLKFTISLIDNPPSITEGFFGFGKPNLDNVAKTLRLTVPELQTISKSIFQKAPEELEKDVKSGRITWMDVVPYKINMMRFPESDALSKTVTNFIGYAVKEYGIKNSRDLYAKLTSDKELNHIAHQFDIYNNNVRMRPDIIDSYISQIQYQG